MPTVISIQHITLRPGVDPAAFERLVTAELVHAPILPHAQVRCFKYDRSTPGAAPATYVLLVEYPSQAARDQYWTTATTSSAAYQQWYAAHGAVWDRYFELVEGPFLDYVELGP